MNFFSVNLILFSIAGYPVSSVELIGTLSGFLCVIYSARGAIISWPLGIINSIFFFTLFYQMRLYPDMFLQIYFLITSIFGWWRWSNPKNEFETDNRDELKISSLGLYAFAPLSTAAIAVSAISGFFISGIHISIPSLFPEPSSFPYADSVVAILSITAQILLSLKKSEAWILWIIVDAAASIIYFKKGIYLVGIEYVIFGIIASAGLWNWKRILSNYESEEA